MKAVIPYLNFDGTAEEAFRFYEQALGGKIVGIVRYSEMGMGGGADGNRVANAALDLGNGLRIMASDTSTVHSAPLSLGNNLQILLEPDSGEEAERIYRELSSGGAGHMPLERTAWAEKYGECSDRFGVNWVINYTGSVQFDPSAAGGQEAGAR